MGCGDGARRFSVGNMIRAVEIVRMRSYRRDSVGELSEVEGGKERGLGTARTRPMRRPSKGGIAKKFGVNGATLGGNEETRVKLEYGKNVKGKPRVANSARGRELRVAAAAARLGQQQKQDDPEKEEKPAKEKREAGDSNESEENEYEEVENSEQATNPDGSQILDRQGHEMVRVCTDTDEDQNDIHVKEEMDELQELNDLPAQQSTLETPQPEIGSETASREVQNDMICPLCSLSNDPTSSSSSHLCAACSHVLHPEKVPGSWSCQSEACSSSKYINAADCGICRLCGASKTTSSPLKT